MFSPYYAWTGWADPYRHCAVNIALYGPGRRRWAMTERGAKALIRDTDTLAIGASRLVWDGAALTIQIDEITAPIPSRIRGAVRLHPAGLNDQTFALDSGGKHRWRPIAPRTRVDVVLEKPGLSWSGDAYFDCNAGDEPLEQGISAWDWSRVHRPDDTLLFYDVMRRDGGEMRLALRAGATGILDPIKSPDYTHLPRTGWRMPRAARGEGLRVIRTLEDAPFYSRSMLASQDGDQDRIVHESLSLDRLRSPIVRAMLPFRMPRVFW